MRPTRARSSLFFKVIQSQRSLTSHTISKEKTSWPTLSYYRNRPDADLTPALARTRSRERDEAWGPILLILPSHRVNSSFLPFSIVRSSSMKRAYSPIDYFTDLTGIHSKRVNSLVGLKETSGPTLIPHGVTEEREAAMHEDLMKLPRGGRDQEEEWSRRVSAKDPAPPRLRMPSPWGFHRMNKRICRESFRSGKFIPSRPRVEG